MTMVKMHRCRFPRLALASLLLLVLLLFVVRAGAAGFSHKNKTASSRAQARTAKNKTSRAHMRKTQNGMLPDTKLTAIQVRGMRKKDTPAQPPSTREVGALQVTTTEGTVKGFIPQYEVQVRSFLG
jgi:hypothetical protein